MKTNSDSENSLTIPDSTHILLIVISERTENPVYLKRKILLSLFSTGERGIENKAYKYVKYIYYNFNQYAH